MRVLIDTHAFLWWGLDDERLSDPARAVIRDGRNEVFVSIATVWEVAIKATKGRLDVPLPVGAFVADRVRRNRWTTLPIDMDHAIRAGTLPMIHGDPFDRLLVAQSQVEGLPLITTDPAITRYEVETIW